MRTSMNHIKHWSKRVRNVSVAHNDLQVHIDGGAENAEFLYIAGFTDEGIRYHKGLFHLEDILIEVNDKHVVGLTQQDLMNRINKCGKKLNFKVVQPGGGLSKDLRSYLAQEFPSNHEVDLDLQDVIRENLYSRTVPCTTRPPRSKEEPGIDYVFVSKENFERMEKNGDFIESGTYNGHYYGTLKPRMKIDVPDNLSEIKMKNNSLERMSCESTSSLTNGEVTMLNDEKNTTNTEENVELDNHFTEV